MKPRFSISPIFLTSLGALILCYSISCNKKATSPPAEPVEVSQDTSHSVKKEEALLHIPEQKIIRESSKDSLDNLGMSMDFSNPDDYMARIAKIFKNPNGKQSAEEIVRLIGEENLTPHQRKQLKQLIGESGVALDPNKPIEKIGEMKIGKHARWALNLKDKAPILFDMERGPDGKWKVAKVAIPEDLMTQSSGTADLPNARTDALNFTHTFLGHLLKQEFTKAKSMVDSHTISDAKLAGMCIIFEDAAYQISKDKPLRAIFYRDTAAGFYANVVSADQQKLAEFSLIVQRKKVGDAWHIHEINLDQLLGDYAKRVAGGDVHYAPLLKNPAGGETLVIYFDFNSEGLTERTRKQLDIVIALLKIDHKKTITISGHTDSLGSQDYNRNLSQKRAIAVRDYLAQQGVASSQVLTEAHGLSQPRRPNTREDGSDNPDGRRANRRTEIYLDF